MSAIGAGVVLALAVLVWRLYQYLPLQFLAIGLLVPAIALAVIAAAGGRRVGRLMASGDVDSVILLGLAVGMVVFTVSLYLVLVPPDGFSWLGFGLIVGAVFAITAWNHRSRSVVPFVVFLLAFGSLAVLVMSTMDDRGASLDVMMFQSEASDALVSGENPFGMTFANPFSPETSAMYWDPSLTKDGVLLFGFPYPPASLVTVVPFHVAFDNFRLAQAVAYLATAVAIVGILPSLRGRRIATAFLLVSPLLYVVGFGWTEPLVMVAVAGVAYAFTRRSTTTPFLVGVAISLKQYAILLLPPSLLLVERPWTRDKVWRAMWPPLAVTGATMIPFLLWGPGDFMNAVIRVQMVQPFRSDSLALPAVVAATIGTPPPLVIVAFQAAAVVGATVVCLRRCPIGAHGFTLGSAVMLLALFAFSKQAFPNYYSLVIGLLFIGAAASLRSTEVAPHEVGSSLQERRVDVD